MQELQKLKSMVNSLEEKNNILLWKLEPGSSPNLQKPSYATNPHQHRSLSREKLEILSAQNNAKSPFNSALDFTQAFKPYSTAQPFRMGDLKSAGELRGSQGDRLGGPRQLDERERLQEIARELETRLKEEFENRQKLHRENEELKTKFMRYKTSVDNEMGSFEEVMKTYESRDANVLRDLEQMLVISKSKIERFTKDFIHLIEAKSSRREINGQYKIDSDFIYLKNFVLERLKEFDRNLMKIGAFTKQSLGSRPSFNDEVPSSDLNRGLYKERELYSPGHKEDPIMDSLTKKKAELYQSIRGENNFIKSFLKKIIGLEDTLQSKRTHYDGGKQSYHGERGKSRTDLPTKDEFGTRFSIVRGNKKIFFVSLKMF